MGCAQSTPADQGAKPPANTNGHSTARAAPAASAEAPPAANGNGATTPSPLYAAPPSSAQTQQQPAPAPAAPPVVHPPGSQAAVNQSLKSLSANEANAVQATLLKVRMLGALELVREMPTVSFHFYRSACSSKNLRRGGASAQPRCRLCAEHSTWSLRTAGRNMPGAYCLNDLCSK